MQKLPDGFVGRMEGRTSGLVSLTGPSGNTWQVRLIKQDNELFFHNGWSTFVGDHLLECGDLLVFRYEGHLQFTVQVFDKNACEKEAAFHSKCSQNSCNFDNIKGQKRDSEENSSLDVVDGIPKKMRRSAMENHGLELAIVGKELSNYEVVKPISMFRETEETSNKCSTSDVPVPFHMENNNEGIASLIVFWVSKRKLY